MILCNLRRGIRDQVEDAVSLLFTSDSEALIKPGLAALLSLSLI